MHLYVHPTGEVRTCCIGQTPLGSCKTSDLNTIWNSHSLKNIRSELLVGNVPSNCEWCKLSETHTNDSMRIRMNKKFKNQIPKLVDLTTKDGIVKQFQLQYADIRFSNLCNFKCRICGPEFSSSILYERNKITDTQSSHLIFPGSDISDLNSQLEEHIPYLKKIYIAGGEPLIQKNHWELLDKLIKMNRTDIELMYSTNLSVLTYKGKYAIDYWNKFSIVEVNASIDGWNKESEYWRKGTNWNDIVSNVKNIRTESPHVRLGMCPTVAWPNLWNVLDLIDHCINTNFINPEHIHINVLQYPLRYALTTLPKFKKIDAIDRINKTLQQVIVNQITGPLQSGLEGLINFIESESTERYLVDFIKFNAILDNVRNEDFFQIFPEHLDIKKYLYENYQKTP